MKPTEHRDKNLQPDLILETVTRLGKRIKERFPTSSLAILCEELRAVSEDAKERSHKIQRPIVALRLASGLLVLLISVGVIGMILSLKKTQAAVSITDFIQLLEAAINDVVLIGAGIFFLVTLETRTKRNRALAAIHELRAFAHIIDMHQLTKDISRLEDTPSSPLRKMSAAELGRYLDYCSEMLSLVGKVAALYIQHFNDGVAIAAVTEVENLTTGLSRKIWQKITLLESHVIREAAVAELASKSASPPLIAEPEAESEAEPEAKAKTEAKAKPQAELEAEAEPEAEAEAEPEPEADAKPGAEAESEADPEADADPEAGPESEADPEADDRPEPDAGDKSSRP